MEAQEQMLDALTQRLEELEAEQAETRETAGSARSAAEAVTAEPLVTSGTSKVQLAISGQVNRMLNTGYDGNKTKRCNVDNENSSTRLRFVGTGQPTETIEVGTILEVELKSNPSTEVSQKDEDTGTANFDDRKAEVYVASERFGKLSLGQGSTASDGTAEVDLSGTTVIDYSDIQKTAGGLLFYDSDTDKHSNTTIGDVFNSFGGLSRRDRVRYDTPKFGGFSVAGDLISNERWSTALRWSGQLAGFQSAAAIAYSDPGGDRDYLVDGSASILYTPTGLNLTVSGRVSDEENRSDAFNAYGKLGWITKFFGFGTTAFSVGYTRS